MCVFVSESLFNALTPLSAQKHQQGMMVRSLLSLIKISVPFMLSSMHSTVNLYMNRAQPPDARALVRISSFSLNPCSPHIPVCPGLEDTTLSVENNVNKVL